VAGLVAQLDRPAGDPVIAAEPARQQPFGEQDHVTPDVRRTSARHTHGLKTAGDPRVSFQAAFRLLSAGASQPEQ
jgi:hypothetical protein